MPEKIRLATIGTGWIAEAFIKAAKQSGLFILEAVYSRNIDKAEEFAKKHGAKQYFASLDDMAKCENIDAIYIASPNSLHYEQSKLFLNAKKHVICEKPITVTASQYEELFSIAQNNNLIYMEAIMPLYLEQYNIIKEKIKGIGRINGVTLNFIQYSSKYPQYLVGELPNIFNPQFCTGALMDLGVYCVYAAHILFGTPDKITASASFMPSGADHSGIAVLSYDGFDVVLNYSKVSTSFQLSEIRADSGIITFDSVSIPQNISVYEQKTKELISEHNYPMEHYEAMIPEAVNFYNRINNIGGTEFYSYADKLAHDVALSMQEIKKSAGINFAL